MAQAQLDEDHLTPEERAEALALFKPGRYTGAPPSELRDAKRRFVPPEMDPWTPGEVAWAAVGAGLLGLAAGWVWRRRREQQRYGTRSPDVVGLDVVLGRAP